jgi:hypothetical protein
MFCIVCLCCQLVVWAQAENENAKSQYDQVATRMVRTALEQQESYRLLFELCKLGPRLAGSDGANKAVAWAAAALKKAGADKVVLQPVTVPQWQRGSVELAEIVESRKFQGKKLTVCALGLSVGTPEEGITAGVLEVRSFEELRQKKEEAKGKLIFFNRPFDALLTNTFAAYGGAVDQRVRGVVEAAQVEALGVLVRSVTSKNDDVPHTGCLAYQENLKQIPGAALGTHSADSLSSALKEEPALQVHLTLSCRHLSSVQSYNVIADIVGSEKPTEVVLVGGHLDAWDKGDGAHDDGAGCVQAMEVLTLLRRLTIKPKRTVRCVLFMNEEFGVPGGAHEYQRLAATSGEKHVAAIESDRGGFTPRGFCVQTKDMSDIVHLQKWLPYLEKAQIAWIRQGGSGADVAQIKNVGLLIGYVPDDQRYFDVHHSDNDTFASVHPRELELGTAAMAILAYLLSEEGER